MKLPGKTLEQMSQVFGDEELRRRHDGDIKTGAKDESLNTP